MRRTPFRTTTSKHRFATVLVLILLSSILAHSPASHAIVFASPEHEPSDSIPPDFPYWDNVTQRRYESPSAIYLGGGWAITAKHVDYGELMFDGEPIPPQIGSRHTLLNSNASIADAVVFELRKDYPRPDLPVLPIATEPPKVGDEVMLIGFGRVATETFEWGPPGHKVNLIRWSDVGEKRWGTNRVTQTGRWVHQSRFLTSVIVTKFESPDHELATYHEASATTGDSGGALFAKYDGEWRLAGLIISVTMGDTRPRKTSMFGDLTYSADLSVYRDEILRWTRAECSNEKDDDGDDLVDYPDDPDCDSPDDRSEWTIQDRTLLVERAGVGAVLLLVAIIGIGIVVSNRRRGR